MNDDLARFDLKTQLASITPLRIDKYLTYLRARNRCDSVDDDLASFELEIDQQALSMLVPKRVDLTSEPGAGAATTTAKANARDERRATASMVKDIYRDVIKVLRSS